VTGVARVGGPQRARVAIGVTAHNRCLFLAEALDSLIAQSYENFTAVVVDDGSTDGTEGVARAYAGRDGRLRYLRFDTRQGMVAAWRTAFEQAAAGGAEYFAWWSDHDRWHPQWLATLVETLDRHPQVALAYPLTQRIDPAGAPTGKPPRQFETFGIDDVATRWKRLGQSDSVAAGDIVYGLMRVDAIRQAGIFREVLCPDRLLVAELTLRGQIRQVPRVLWFRRQFDGGSVARQRATLFPTGVAVPSPLTPPWFMHARSLWTTYGRENPGVLGRSRLHTAWLIANYASAYAWRHYGKSSVQRGLLSVLGWPRWVYKRAKHAALLSVYAALVTSRRLGVTDLVERTRGRLH
jgi:glycosyltransferase involved in cell wall biosynthesis